MRSEEWCGRAAISNFKFHLIFAPLGIAQTSLALHSLVAKIQNFKL